jgi:hypothetical protein
MSTSINCTPLSQYGAGISVRPAKSQTASRRVPPLYRNPGFFTSGGQPKHTACDERSTGYTTGTQTRFGANKGKVQLGKPVAGTSVASTTRSGGIVIFPYAIRTTGRAGEFNRQYPYIYSYTYATLRNNDGAFGPGQGPGSFNYKYQPYDTTVASITVKQGPQKFGGTMKMLGALTTKVCYWLKAGGGGCSLGGMNWRYEAVGAPAKYTQSGVITKGAIYTHYTFYSGGGSSSPIWLYGARFPWTTGSVTVTAVGRGPHKTVHYANGYDNRTPTSGYGTIQLVSPLLTHWFGFVDFETGGIGVLRIKFAPEPQAWVMLVAGASLLCVGARVRGRRASPRTPAKPVSEYSR